MTGSSDGRVTESHAHTEEQTRMGELRNVTLNSSGSEANAKSSELRNVAAHARTQGEELGQIHVQCFTGRQLNVFANRVGTTAS